MWGCLPEGAAGSINRSDTYTRSQSSAVTSQSRDPRSSSRERVISIQPDVDLTELSDTSHSQRTTSASTPQRDIPVKHGPKLHGNDMTDALIGEYCRQQSIHKTKGKNRHLPHAGASALTAHPHFSGSASLPSRLVRLTGQGPSDIRREFYHFLIDLHMY